MFQLISIQIIKMFLLMMVGVICSKCGLIDSQGNRTLSNILLMLINPLLLVNAFLQEFDSGIMTALLITALVCALTHVIAIPLAHFAIREKDNPDYSVERFSAVYSNCGFIGIPLVNSLFGSKGIMLVSVYLMVFNVITWTHGLILITGDTSLKQIKKGLLSPVVIGALTGLCIFLFHIPVHPILKDTIAYISDMNTPMAMIIAGVSLAGTDILKALKSRGIYLVIALKLLVIPVILTLVLSLLPGEPYIYMTALVLAACPTAASCTMFAIRFNKNHLYASEIFALTTVASMVTIPLIVLLGEQLIR